LNYNSYNINSTPFSQTLKVTQTKKRNIFPQSPIAKHKKRVNKLTVKLNDGCLYTGEWLGDKIDGHGFKVWPNGSQYEGEWRNNQMNGFGKMIHAEGEVYEGHWVNGKSSGEGTYT